MLPKLFITDIDGVWTDGGMYYTPQGDAMKRFSVRDGWGVEFLRQAGIPLAIMTGEDTPIVTERARKLGITRCHTGVTDKLALATSLCNELGITLADTAFIGDDINDLPLLRAAGFSGAPADAPGYIRAEVKFPGLCPGGHGAFREFVETVLSLSGTLRPIIQRLSLR